jgi:hypothetical protein
VGSIPILLCVCDVLLSYFSIAFNLLVCYFSGGFSLFAATIFLRSWFMFLRPTVRIWPGSSFLLEISVHHRSFLSLSWPVRRPSCAAHVSCLRVAVAAYFSLVWIRSPTRSPAIHGSMPFPTQPPRPCDKDMFSPPPSHLAHDLSFLSGSEQRAGSPISILSATSSSSSGVLQFQPSPPLLHFYVPRLGVLGSVTDVVRLCSPRCALLAGFPFSSLYSSAPTCGGGFHLSLLHSAWFGVAL